MVLTRELPRANGCSIRHPLGMRLRAITYNVHKCVGGVDRRYDPERVAEVIAHYSPDIVLLQEVAQRSPKYRNERQVERLGDLLDLRHRSYFTNVKKLGRGGEYGNALLSRFPLTAVENVSVTIPPKKARAVLHARCRVRTGPGKSRSLHVFNLHLGLSGLERKLQLKKFLASHPFAGLDRRTPVLVAGDFNDVWGSLGRFLGPFDFTGPHSAPKTFPAAAPLRALDSVYVRGDLSLLHLRSSRLKTARSASDHLPLVADLHITSGRRSTRRATS